MIKNKLNRIFSIAFVMLFVISANIYAASLSGNSSINVGDIVTLTFNFGTNVGAYDSLNVSYDSSMFEFVSGDSLNEQLWWDQTEESKGISTKTYTFKALKDGSSRITVVSNGVISANETMDELGTITAEKLINVSKKQESVQPPVDNTNNNTTIKPVTPTSSANNYLKYLQISEEGLNPNFTRNVTEYSLSVGENVNSIQVLARAEDSNARVEISGHENIVDGENKIRIKVTAQNGYYRIYTITVNKSKDKEKSNAYLENLIIENYELDKQFQSEVLEYNIGEILSTVDKLNVVASAKDSNANIEIIGADTVIQEGEGKVIVKVTAQDGTTIKEYIIKYAVKAATNEQEIEQEMKDYLKEIQSSKDKKQVVILYLKYIWSAIKKNYLLVLMYLLILIEFIQIIVLRRKLKKSNDSEDPTNPGGDNNPPQEKEILKIDMGLDNINDEEKIDHTIQSEESFKIEPPKVEPLLESVVDDFTAERVSRRGSLSKAEGIKLVDLDKNDGPQDELTFNIFENLNEEDIKQLLEEQIDKDK